MIIDTHVHIFNDDLAKRASAKLQATAKIPCYTDFTEHDTRQKLREWGVDLGVVLPIATKPSQQRTINDWALTLQHGNLICFGTVHPDAKDAIDELQRIRNMGLYGVKLHPDYQNFYVDDPKLFPIYEALCSLGLPVVFHAGFDPVSPQVTHAAPQGIAHVLKEFPGLKVIAAHMGGILRYDDVEQYLVGKNVFFDISMSPVYCSLPQFERILKKHGADKILYASDCPWSLFSDEMALLEHCRLTAREMDLILYRNAARILGLSQFSV